MIEITFTIGDACIGSVDGSCLEVCPVNCIYGVGVDPEEPDQPYIMVIDPDECIDCSACVTECPVDAITADTNVPERWAPYLELGEMHRGRGNEDGEVIPDPSKQDIADKAAHFHTALDEVSVD